MTPTKRRLGCPGKVIYELVEGHRKTAGGDRGGRQDLSSWSTVVLSTGESRLLDFAKASDVGTTHRVISLHGNPWGPGMPSTVKYGALREGLELTTVMQAAHLFAGSHTKPACLETWKARRRQLHQQFELNSNDPNRGANVSLKILLRYSSLQNLHMRRSSFLGLSSKPTAWQRIFAEITESTEHQCAHRKAFIALWEWCWSHRDTFWGSRRKVEAPPPQGWVGRWDNLEQWDELYVIPGAADKHLESLGYKPLSIRKEWVEAGYLRRGEGRNLLPAVRIDGTKVALFGDQTRKRL